MIAPRQAKAEEICSTVALSLPPARCVEQARRFAGVLPMNMRAARISAVELNLLAQDSTVIDDDRVVMDKSMSAIIADQV
jgi:hypothetical protein